ncbi:MAG: alcohol dehydrogenase class IV [Phenylobacterium sp.]|jgi:alcohol dehydrogenase class IV
MPDSTQLSQLNGNWNYPTNIRFGAGRINELADICQQLQFKKPLLVTDKGLAKLAMTGDILRQLTDAGLQCELFGEIKPNPTGNNIIAGAEYYHWGNHDSVIALGGGSALDAGKAIALMVGQTRPLWDFEDVGDNWQRVNEQGMAPVIAIPTTAGTGSEVGRASVIVDEQQRNKKLIFHPNMLPQMVLADPALTAGLPAHITAATGLDALVHNLEAYCAPGYHPMADGIALEAMRLIKQWLPKAVNDGNDLVARSHMMVASTMGATAFQKGLGGVHALAHPLGAIFDAHHGLLNAILLPYVLIRNREAIEDKISEIAHHLRLEQANFAGFMTWLTEFSQALKIPTTLSDIGINDEHHHLIGEQALLDPSAGGNPIALTAQDYSEIFIGAVNGTGK